MKAIVVITDSEAMKAFERAFIESGGRGFTSVRDEAGVRDQTKLYVAPIEEVG